MNTPQEQFLTLVGRVLDGRATAAERKAFRALLREYPELIDDYRRQTDMDTLVGWKFGQRTREKRWGEKDKKPVGGTWQRVGWKVAAAAAVLLVGVGILREWGPVISGMADGRWPMATASSSPVTLESQANVRGLDLPGELPGLLRLSSGEVVVRLGSGVQLAVLGPASLEVRDVMQVRLERGRLLANVPHWATGFRVRTADLDVCDLGTVFSVSVDFPVSDVFVFKGRVRVNAAGHGETENAATGESLGICVAGEGVRAEAGERPVKFAADWLAAKKAFASVRDQAATEKPAVAMAFAEKIADLWMDAYLPREMSRLAAERLAAASAPKIPFLKTAWVRPSVPRQEASNMKTTSAAAVLTAAALSAGTAIAVSEPPVSVDAFPGRDNRHWTTVYTNEVPLRWEWNTNAANAQLAIIGMNGAAVTNFASATSNWVWRAFASNVPATEDVYTLTLTFYNGGGAVVGAMTSRLAVVTGAFGQTPVDPVVDSKTWAKVKENVVILYDAGWAESTAAAANSRLVIAKTGGAAQTNALTDASGYYGWKIKRSDWEYGAFNLALTFPGRVGEWDATLIRPMDGTLIRMQ